MNDDRGNGDGAGAPDDGDPIGVGGFPNCDETIERLYTYLDGELTEDRRREIQRHLDLCGPCVSAFEFESDLRRLIANRCKDRVPDSLMERVASALHDEHLATGGAEGSHH